MIDPVHSLAFSIQANRGVYAVLVGSGVSRAAKIPTGWEITLDLIRKLAKIRGETSDPDPVGYLLSQQGKPKDAIAAYNQAIRLKPDYAEAYFNRGNSKGTMGRIDEARQDFEKTRDLAHKAGDDSLVALAEQVLQRLDSQEGE